MGPEIVHVVYRPRYSGAELLVTKLTSIHRQNGMSSKVVAICPPDERFSAEIHEQRSLGIPWVVPSRELGRTERVRFLHAHLSQHSGAVFAHSVIPALYARIVKPDVITVLHDASQDDYKTFKLRCCERILRARTKSVIAVTHIAQANYFRRFGTKPVVIPNGIDLQRFTPSAETAAAGQQWKQEFGIRDASKVLLQVGRYSTAKGQLESVRALAPLLADRPDLNLVFIGEVEDRSYFEAVEAAAKSSRARHQIWLAPAVNAVERILAAADVYLMPSVKEAHSLAMLEALTAGLPIVASSISSFDFLESYAGTYKVAPENSKQFRCAVESALSGPRRYVRDVASFDINHTAARYAEMA